MPQNASAAERLGVFIASSHSAPKANNRYVGDCTGAFTILYKKAVTVKSPWAGLAKELQQKPIAITGTRWTKSHRVVNETMSPDEVRDIHSNSLVDTEAKETTKMFSVHDVDISLHNKTFNQTSCYLRAAASMLALWPSCRELYGDLPKVDGGTVCGQIGKISHSFVWRGKLWQCTRCFKRKHSLTGWADRSACRPVPHKLAQLFESQNGHALWLTSDHNGSHTAFCTKCGNHASTLPKALTSQCRPSKKYSYALACFLAVPSKHPRTGIKLAEPIPGEEFCADLIAVRNGSDISSPAAPQVEIQRVSSSLQSFDPFECDDKFIPGDLIESDDDLGDDLYLAQC